MKKEYQNEINQVHAPKELIERTKNKMKQENRRVGKIDKRLLHITSFSAISATIVLSFILISLFYNKTPISDSSREKQNPIHLSNINKEPEQLIKSEGNNGDAIYTEDLIEVFVIEKIPEEFQSAVVEKDDLGTFPILIIKDENSLFYKAVVEINEQKYLVISEMIEIEDFMNAVKKFVKTID